MNRANLCIFYFTYLNEMDRAPAFYMRKEEE